MSNKFKHLYEFENFRLDAENPNLWCENKSIFLILIIFLTSFAYLNRRVNAVKPPENPQTAQTEAEQAYTRGKMILGKKNFENREEKAIDEFQNSVTSRSDFRTRLRRFERGLQRARQQSFRHRKFRLLRKSADGGGQISRIKSESGGRFFDSRLDKTPSRLRLDGRGKRSADGDKVESAKRGGASSSFAIADTARQTRRSVGGNPNRLRTRSGQRLHSRRTFPGARSPPRV